MSMLFGNPALQYPGLLLWDGNASAAIDLRRHVGFGFTFQVMNDLANDTIFNVIAAPADDVDPCIAGAFEPVPEVLTCVGFYGPNPIPAPQATITLPAGTPAGSMCAATLPCVPDAFVALAAGGGDTASVRAVITLSRPK